MGVFSDNLRLLQSAPLTAPSKRELFGGDITMLFLQNVLSFVIIYLPLRGRWHDEVVTEGVPAGGGRRYPQIPFKFPNVFMAYVAMPQAAASPRPALSKPPATAA